jgi:uncharacterized membrane protein YGL010W
MRRVDALFADYSSHHRTRGNLVCHAFGITLIVFGIVSMLRAARLPGATSLTAAEVLIAAAVLFYLTLDVPLAAAIAVELALLDVLARAAGDWRIGLAAFGLGWVFQGIGHGHFEKNRPAFVKNLAHLMIGPLFLVNELLRLRPVAHAGRAPD